MGAPFKTPVRSLQGAVVKRGVACAPHSSGTRLVYLLSCDAVADPLSWTPIDAASHNQCVAAS